VKLFAATCVGFGIASLVDPSFAPFWQPTPNSAFVYIFAALSLAAGAGLLWPRTAVTAARVLLANLVIWLLAFRSRDVAHAPGAFGSWDGCAETVVFIAAAWLLTGDRGARVARALYGAAMIMFGVAHFVYARETATLVPSWLPAHLAWAYATGCTFVAAGVAVLAGMRPRLAAALSGLQMALFAVLVWIPIVARGAASAFVWNELGISVALAAAAWIVADSITPGSRPAP
jgi:uncharacterized membrane protein